MELLEQRDQWEATFRANWLAHLEKTGQIDWSLYNRPKNTVAPAGKAINLATSRIVLISSAGGYLPASQDPFDTQDPRGDYTIRTFPANVPFDQISYAHTHYNHDALNADPQVLMPLQHLADLADEGIIGGVAPDMISFMGYQPDVIRVVDEMMPAILDAVEASGADAALVVPA
ncbi:MAG: glycine/sarcosine/betaine reductase selenoprotein B family protein [Candidatus Promineifilaceae bacterium]